MKNGFWIASLAAAALLFLIPVSNKIQSCGTPAAFLAGGRVSVVVGDQRPPGISPSEARSINRHTCSELVSARAVPGFLLLVVSLLTGVAGFVLAWIGHRSEDRELTKQRPKPAG